MWFYSVLAVVVLALFIRLRPRRTRVVGAKTSVLWLTHARGARLERGIVKLALSSAHVSDVVVGMTGDGRGAAATIAAAQRVLPDVAIKLVIDPTLRGPGAIEPLLRIACNPAALFVYDG